MDTELHIKGSRGHCGVWTMASYIAGCLLPPQVTVLGKITNVRETNQALTLTITDGTGSIEVDHYPAEDPDLVRCSASRARWLQLQKQWQLQRSSATAGWRHYGA